MMNSAMRVLVATMVLAFAIDGTAGVQLEEDGKAIYLTGMLPDGTALVARGIGGVSLQGELAACVRCHRPSGYGSSESDIQAAAVAAPILFKKLTPRRDRLLRSLYQERYGELAQTRAKTPRSRSAYHDAQDILNAVRGGIDPVGEALSPLMPRYDIDMDEAAAIKAFLSTLGAEPPPGVGQETIHFATIIGDGVDTARRHTLLRVMRAYIDLHNREIERERIRPNYSPLYKSELLAARRYWQLHVWRLPELRSAWSHFLNEQYASHPVFAVLSGVAPGFWKPIQDFCESHRIPCIFPQTDWPEVQPGAYTLYLSEGFPGEARLAANWLSGMQARRVLQITGSGLDAKGSAEALKRQLHDSDISLKAVSLEDVRVGRAGKEFDSAVLWLDGDEFLSLSDSGLAERLPGHLLASGSLLATHDRRIPSILLTRLPDRLQLIWRYAVPGSEPPRLYRLRAWLATRRIPDGKETTALSTYLAMDAVRHALVHAVDRFSREYLIEIIEHEIENAQNPGVFPRLSLGPGQRFAAKGTKILGIQALANGQPASSKVPSHFSAAAADRHEPPVTLY